MKKDILCPTCNDYYSSTYRKCPFCELKAKDASRSAPADGYAAKERYSHPILIFTVLIVLLLLTWYLYGDILMDKIRDEQGQTNIDQPIEPNVNQGNTNPDDYFIVDPVTGELIDPNAGDVNNPAGGVVDPNSGTVPGTDVAPEVDPFAPSYTPIRMSSEDVTLVVKDPNRNTFKAKVLGTNENPVWHMKDTSVAKVAGDGTVTAVGKGRTTLFATVGDETVWCIIRVVEEILNPIT